MTAPKARMYSARPVVVAALVPPHGWLRTMGAPRMTPAVLRRMRRYGASRVAVEHLGVRTVRDMGA